MVYRSILIKMLLADAQTGRHPRPAYFYCSRSASEPECTDPGYLLRCIARQLSRVDADQPLPLPAFTVYHRRVNHGDLNSPLSLRECTELIIELTANRSLTVLIIDALDECHDDQVDDLLDALTRIVSDSSRVVKVFISSRNDQRLVHQLGIFPNIEVKASNNQADISTFVSHKLNLLIEKRKLLSGEVPDCLTKCIIRVLCKEAHGM